MMDANDNPPEGSIRAGYAALAADLGLAAPLRSRSAIADRRIEGDATHGGWRLFDRRVRHPRTPVEHLDFALRREPVDLLMLKKAFRAIGARDVADYVEATPAGVTQRRAWYLYEWLTGETLDLPDGAARLAAVDVLDPDAYHVAGKGVLSPRHRVIDNLPGTPAFCALARRDGPLPAMTDEALRLRLSRVLSSASADVTRRATAHLVMGESRSSFAIEGERPPLDRLQRWGATLAGAGRKPLGLDMLAGLQAQVLGHSPMMTYGLRRDGVYLGTRDRHGDVVPEFIGARPEDLRGLMEGIIEYDRRMMADRDMDPVVHAAGLAFGMVYVHPFEDGNGRIHRYLINHAMAGRGAVPGGAVLPVSSVMLDRIDDYQAVLKAHSAPLMPFIPWRQNERGNVVVEADTSDLYRYPDVTLQAGFLRECVERTLDRDFPREIAYIASYDRARRAIDAIADLPGKRADDFIVFLRQNEAAPGTLPKKRRKRDFGFLDDAAVARMEQAVRDAFDMDDPEEECAPPTP